MALNDFFGSEYCGMHFHLLLNWIQLLHPQRNAPVCVSKLWRCFYHQKPL